MVATEAAPPLRQRWLVLGVVILGAVLFIFNNISNSEKAPDFSAHTLPGQQRLHAQYQDHSRHKASVFQSLDGTLSDDDHSSHENQDGPQPVYNTFGYPECVAFLTAADVGNVQKHHARWKGTAANLTWVHFPKCGSSFAVAIHNVACDRKQHTSDYYREKHYADEIPCICGDNMRWDRTVQTYIDWNSKRCNPNIRLLGEYRNHVPWWKTTDYNKYKGSFVAMFRDPRRRIVSAYNNGKHAWGLPSWLRPGKANITSPLEFVKYPGIAGCQCKMVLGEACASTLTLDKHHIDKCIQRVRQDFLFVGLQEFWNESVCLFHFLNGGDPNTLTEESFMDSRVGKGYNLSSVRKDGSPFAAKESYITIKDTDEPADWKLYMAVRDMFKSQLHHAGLEVPLTLLEDA